MGPNPILTGVLIKGGNMDPEIHTVRGRCEQIQGEDGHVQTKERGLEQILPSRSSEGTNPAHTLIPVFQPPEL